MSLLINQPLQISFQRRPVFVRSSPILSLLTTQPSQLSFQRRPVFVRSSLIPSDGLSLQTPPCMVLLAEPFEADLGKLLVHYMNENDITYLEKKVPLELIDQHAIGTVGSSHGWVATLKDDGIMWLQDDLNPLASDSDPKRIPLPPLVTLSHCQTQVVTNISMSTPSPQDDDCVLAVKFLGPQLSFLRPGRSNSEWINVRTENPCFFSSRVTFSKRNDVFRLLGSGGHIMGSWGVHKENPKIQKLRFRNLPYLPRTTRQVLSSCCTSEHLVESESTGETFLIKWYREAIDEIIDGIAKMETKAFLVFKLDEQGNAIYTKDIGDLCIFLSNSEPFCVPSSSFPGLDSSNRVYFFDFDDFGCVDLATSSIISKVFDFRFGAPYIIPPQNID